MLVDTQPATHQHAPASPEVRDAWVNAQLIGVLMDNVGPTVAAAAVAVPVLVILMAGEVWTPALVAWTVAIMAMLLFRYRLIGLYRLRHDSVEGPQRQAFIDTYRWTWLAVSLLWGGPVAMSFLQAGFITQFACGLVVLGQGLFTLNAYSAYLPVFRAFTHGLAASVLTGLLIGAFTHPDAPDVVRTTTVFVLLVIAFWVLLLMAGARLHRVHRSSFELQFSNQVTLPSFRVTLSPTITRPFFAVPRTSVARTA